MASINDLAAAATIASSAVALQSPPAEPTPAAPSPEPSPAAPPSPSAPAAAQPTPPLAPATQEETLDSAPAAAPPPEPATTTTSTTSTSVQPPQPTPPPPASAVLAAPQISPQDAVSAQFPAPPPAVAPATPDGAGPGGASATPNGSAGGADDDNAGASARQQKPVRGAFVVFEGMDRAGKTTQAKLLQQRCVEEGKAVKFMRFPDRTTPIGQMIDAYLRGQTEIEDHVIHLLFSANRWEALKTIQTTLAAGVSIVCDRYYHSGIVYSAAKQNPALPLAWAKAPEVGLPRPDLVLFLDLDEHVARERGGWGGEVYEKGEMQRRVRELFWGLSMGDLGPAAAAAGRERRAASAPDGPPAAAAAVAVADPKDEFRQEEEDLHIIDADLPVEDLAEKVWAHVQPRLETVERGHVGATVRTVH